MTTREHTLFAMPVRCVQSLAKELMSVHRNAVGEEASGGGVSWAALAAALAHPPASPSPRI